jgi:hypothetical protein
MRSLFGGASRESAKPGPEYPKVAFAEPLPYGYLYAGLEIDPPGRAPFVRRSARREEALEECKAVAGRLEALGGVVRATVYRAVLIPPIVGAPRFDAVVLVQTDSPEAIAGVRSSEAFGRLGADFVMGARNARRIGDTEETLSGTFLFNHFAAEDPEGAVQAWEDLTGWYTAKTGVDNSALLRPIGDAPYAFVNYVRLPRGPGRFMLDQLVRPSFHTFVRAKLRANGMVAMPLLCEPV